MKLCTLFFLTLISITVNAQKPTNAKKPQEDMTCVATAPYSGCLIFYKKDLEMTDNGYVFSGVLGQDYALNAVYEQSDFTKSKIFVSKGSKITFYYPNVNKLGLFDGSIEKCILAQAAGMPCWGQRESIIFPKGTYVSFYINVTGPNNYQEKRVSQVILGADTQLPGIGLCKKGTNLNFTYRGMDFNAGYIEKANN